MVCVCLFPPKRGGRKPRMWWYSRGERRTNRPWASSAPAWGVPRRCGELSFQHVGIGSVGRAGRAEREAKVRFGGVHPHLRPAARCVPSLFEWMYQKHSRYRRIANRRVVDCLASLLWIASFRGCGDGGGIGLVCFVIQWFRFFAWFLLSINAPNTPGHDTPSHRTKHIWHIKDGCQCPVVPNNNTKFW